MGIDSMENDLSLETKKLEKRYGSTKALNGFDYTFHEGITGILGPNGAGKSTLIGILIGQIKQDKGTVRFNQSDIRHLPKSILGVCPQELIIYPHFTVNEFLYYIATLKGMKNVGNEIVQVLKLVNMEKYRYRKIVELSGGMKQRISIAQALLGNPDILIFDEPTSGLDPYQRVEIRNLFFTFARNHIVIITTHVVQDIEFIADHILIMDSGKIVQSGNTISLLKHMEGKVHNVSVSNYSEASKLNGVLSGFSYDGYHLNARMISDSLQEGINVMPTLEDVYLYYMNHD